MDRLIFLSKGHRGMSATGFSFEQLATHLLQGFVEALPCQGGETEAHATTRTRTAIFSIMAFLPRDALEMMLSGQVVMHNALIQDSARDILRGQTEALKARTKSTAVALSRLMLAHLSTLRRAQTRPAEGAMETRQQQTAGVAAPMPESRTGAAPAPASAASPAVKPSAQPSSPLTAPPFPVTPPSRPAAMSPASASRGAAPSAVAASAVAASVAAPSTIAPPAAAPPPVAMHPSILPPLVPPFSVHPPAAPLFAAPETLPGGGRGSVSLKQSLLASTASALAGPAAAFPGAAIPKAGVLKM